MCGGNRAGAASSIATARSVRISENAVSGRGQVRAGLAVALPSATGCRPGTGRSSATRPAALGLRQAGQMRHEEIEQVGERRGARPHPGWAPARALDVAGESQRLIRPAASR